MTPKFEEIRVRFAPSPTGPLHLGGARTALFNWLFARNGGGRFVLRIEDTDVERSEIRFENDIKEGLEWLGLNWDEGPYRQSERLDVYEKYLKKLVDEKKAYRCFCSKEELETERQAMLAQGLAPRYSGRCGRLSKEETRTKLERGEPAVIRLRIPETTISFGDLVKGKVSFNAALIGDIVIAKNFRSPLYNFVVVIDDFEMKISHVIRGEDHISNTPKQIAIQEALGFSRPIYAHLPLILSKDRGKLSKRYLETSVMEYRRGGYLKEAMVNFLALLGWHPENDREVLTVDELIKEFSLKRVGKAGAALNIEKLDWLNAQHLKLIPADQLIRRLEPFVSSLGWHENRELLLKVAEIEKERMKKLSDFPKLAAFFFDLPEYNRRLLIWQNIPEAEIAGNFRKLISIFREISPDSFEASNLEKAVASLIAERGRGEVLWPLRAALSGQEASPGPFEIAESLGKEETLRRLEIAVQKLNE